MRIASHHRPGTGENRLSKALGTSVDYMPVCDWPEDCTVQWGNGIIPSTPFFEAFPKGTFIRGEGPDIAAAERQAFEKYQRDLACAHVWGRHRPGRETYLNGAAFCRRCGGFRGQMFPEVRELGWWRRPLTRNEAWHLDSLENDPELDAVMDAKYPHLTESRKRSARILRLRQNIYGSEPGAEPRR